MKRLIVLISILFFAFGITGCGSENEQQEDMTSFQIYYVDKEETKLISREYQTDKKETTDLLMLLFDQLKTMPEDAKLRAAIPNKVALESYSLSEGYLVMNFKKEYYDMSAIGEVLTRAAIVRTLCQIEDIEYISFTVDGSELVDKSGNLVGVMTADQFIDNAGNEISSYGKADLVLYFADDSGKNLESFTREVVYNSNISIEKLVVEQLIAGPIEEVAKPTMNPDSQVNSITIKDGVCYVDLSKEFLEQKYNTTPEVTIYSIVNSLVELPNVNKVQISIDGETNISYLETVSLANILERNLEIIK